MFVESRRTHRLSAACCALALMAFAGGMAPLMAEAVIATTVHAAPLDCTPVGVERIGNQLYYVENCFGYDVYRPL